MSKDFEIMFLLFIIYSVFGWAMETVITSIQNKKLLNRGFLIGPCCPIYGCGCIAITLLLKKYMDDKVALFVFSAIICSILEYVTSYIMEKLFKARWWDYSHIKFNLNGRICLINSILFGLLAFVIMYYINPLIIQGLNKINDNILDIITYILMFILAIDSFVSFNVMSKIKQISFEVKKDNTAEITKKVKEILMNSNFFIKRITQAFPNLQSTLKSKRQEFEEKRLSIMYNLKKNIHLNNSQKLNIEKKYKLKDDVNEKV